MITEYILHISPLFCD